MNKQLKKITTSCLIVATLLASTSVFAMDSEEFNNRMGEGMQAYIQKDYATATNLFQRLYNEGNLDYEQEQRVLRFLDSSKSNQYGLPSKNQSNTQTATQQTTNNNSISTAEFDRGMAKGIDYFNRGLYKEAKDEIMWFYKYNASQMNAGQKQYLNDYLQAIADLNDNTNKKYSTSNIYKFSVVNLYNNKLYCSYNPAIYGFVNEEICNELPYGLHNLGHIYSFTCYNGYIYYLTGPLGSDSPICSIYRCDMDGKNNVYIASNAYSISECYIANNYLFYTTKEDEINRINLQTGEYDQIYTTDANISLKYYDGNNLYINAYKRSEQQSFCIDNNGEQQHNIPNGEPITFNDCMNDGYAYKFYDGAVYRYDRDNNSTWLFNIPRAIGEYAVCQDVGRVENVLNNKIYYKISLRIPYGIQSKINTLLLRCDMNGQNIELVGIYFQP